MQQMNKTDNKIYLFTDSYPYPSASENTFLDPELPHLLAVFPSVTIIPKDNAGEAAPVAREIVVDISLSEILKSSPLYSFFQYTLLALASKVFYQEILKTPPVTLHPGSILKNIFFLGKALKTRRWLEQYIKNNHINPAGSVFYTYWLNELTYGICLLKPAYPHLIVISRAHGADLYEERHTPPYIPFRPESFGALNRIFADSLQGKEYLQKKYPGWISKFSVSRLGVPQQSFISRRSDDGILRIISCSFLVPVKRIDLLIQGLAVLGARQKNKKIEWTHIGAGPLFAYLTDMAQKTLPENITYTFLGAVPGGGVIDYYKNHRIDFFINVSASEGTPVTIMEAQSCGIPVIATAVGGNPEIVNDENGFLLSPNPSPGEIAEMITGIIDNPALLSERKKKSLNNWDANYNADKNFKKFSHDLAGLVRP